MSFVSRLRNRTRPSNHAGITIPPTPSSSDPNQPLDGHGGGTIHSSEYAQRCKEIMALYRALVDLGVNTTFDFDLPQVVVIGDQSSGKSSLVEAVSGINVPRDAGTCTRCPMECRMSSDTSWSCTIEIRQKYDANGSRLQNVITMPFGTAITDKSQVELWLRRAQAAVLNPDRNMVEFYSMSERQLKDLSANNLGFSKNVVQITVKDPEAPELCFVDLPGIIHNGEQRLIDTVKQLVQLYIKNKNAVIVIAMPMATDYQNMEAVNLAKEHSADPGGDRTIGVLTKPDVLTSGSTSLRDMWRKVLEGTEHPTTHGYYCVRLPDDEQRARGITKSEMQQQAEEFFNATAPWNEIDPSRFGIPNFVDYISQLLVELIEKHLPQLTVDVDRELARCRKEFAGLPRRSSDEPMTVIMLALTAFCQAVSDTVWGKREEHFVQSNRALYSKFKQDIIETTPDFRPLESVNASSCCVPQSRTEPRCLRDVRQVIKRCITWELPRHVPFEATKTLIMQYTGLWTKPTYNCFDRAVRASTKLLDKLLEIHFGQYVYLEKYVRTLALEERGRCEGEARVMLSKILRLESIPVFTQNPDFVKLQNDWHSRLTTGARSGRNQHFNQVPLHIFPKEPLDPEVESGEVTWGTEDEIKIMANVEGYFEVAHKRFMDYIPLVIEHELHQNLADNLRNTLINALVRDSQNGRIGSLDELLQEDPVIAKKRADLQEKISSLEQIQEKLEPYRRLDVASIHSQEVPDTASILSVENSDQASQAGPVSPPIELFEGDVVNP